MTTGIFKDYVEQNIIGAVLKKANSYSVVVYKLIKKPVKSKLDPRRENDSSFELFPRCLVLMMF